MFVGYKDAVSKYAYDQKAKETVYYCHLPSSVMRAANTWMVQTKYLNTYTVYGKTFYAAVLHVTMTGIDVDFKNPKEQKHISFEG